MNSLGSCFANAPEQEQKAHTERKDYEGERGTDKLNSVCRHGFRFVRPNAELTGRRRMDALPARRRIGKVRLAGKVASHWRSG